MKSGNLVLFLAGLICFGASYQAQAGEAKCGDTRKIERGASSNEYIDACFGSTAGGIAQGQVQAQALRAALDRISKFDSECVGKAGGRIVATDTYPRSNAKVAWKSVTESHCESVYVSGVGTRQICTDFQLPADPYCVVSADAAVVHKCVCD